MATYYVRFQGLSDGSYNVPDGLVPATPAHRAGRVAGVPDGTIPVIHLGLDDVEDRELRRRYHAGEVLPTEDGWYERDDRGLWSRIAEAGA